MIFLQVIFLASLVAAASATFNLSYILPEDDPWYVPNFVDETYTWISKSTVQNEMALLATDPNVVQYLLFTRSSPYTGYRIDYEFPTAIRYSYFNPAYPTSIVIHGYASSFDTPLSMCALVRDAEFNKGSFRNIICLDWSKIASKSYPTARFTVPSIAEDLVKFIRFLVYYGGMKIKDLTILGHSLGAHIAGLAAKVLKQQNQLVPLIIAGDPVGLLFDYEDCSTRICKSDAQFVQSIHTSGGRLGFLRPIGGAAFYVNGGLIQPGCGLDLIGVCAHLKAYKYLAEAIGYDDFPAYDCGGSLLSATLQLCGKKYSGVRMASMGSIGIEGIFDVPVNPNQPYGKGLALS